MKVYRRHIHKKRFMFQTSGHSLKVFWQKKNLPQTVCLLSGYDFESSFISKYRSIEPFQPKEFCLRALFDFVRTRDRECVRTYMRLFCIMWLVDACQINFQLHNLCSFSITFTYTLTLYRCATAMNNLAFSSSALSACHHINAKNKSNPNQHCTVDALCMNHT